MKNVLCVLLALGALAFLSAPALGHWNPGDPYKWVQTPDLTATGVDVNCTTHSTFGPIRVVASDFPCTSTGPIDDFHIWGSWKNDLLPYGNANAVTFRLSIYGDVPADQQNFSHPLTQPVLWQGTFTPGTYQSRQYVTNINEWYYDPVGGEAIYPGDHVCWQYNFDVRDLVGTQPFLQQGTLADPKVYWLAVSAVVDDPNADFGWKTTPLNQRWNDDATWQIDNLDNWNELFYPSAHPLNGVSADMAFVITPEPSTVVLLLSGAVALLLCGWRRWNRK
jgi:hypothetical protein